MFERILKWRGKSSKGTVGVLGESTSNSDFKVGDVIVYRNPYMQKSLTKTIICQDSKGMDYPMGLGGTTIQDLLDKTEVIKVISHENLTDEICKEVEESIKVEKVEIKQMTLEQIERELGYKVRII